MIKTAYLRVMLAVSMTLLVMLAMAGGRSGATSMDACDDCVHQCKLDKDACIARGVPAAECEAKYNNCVGQCPCLTHE